MPTDWKSRYHYREQEYFIAGTATAYQAQGALNQDGTWSVTPAGTAPYKTRLLVREPTDPKKFNGTVVVEWLNVTAGRDSDADFGFAGPGAAAATATPMSGCRPRPSAWSAAAARSPSRATTRCRWSSRTRPGTPG